MQEILKNGKFKLIINEEGAALYRRYSGKPVSFIPWEEVAEIGFYLGKGQGKKVHYDVTALPFPAIDDSCAITEYVLCFYVSRVTPAARTGEALAFALRQSGLMLYITGGQGAGAYSAAMKRRNVVMARLRAVVPKEIRFIEAKN